MTKVNFFPSLTSYSEKTQSVQSQILMPLMTQKKKPIWPHTGAILAGGQSRRMGFPKESAILWDGRPMIAHVLETLMSLCREVIILGECIGHQDFSNNHLSHLKDIRPGLGPISGLETLLASQKDTNYLVVSCDQPLLTPELLRRLTERENSTLAFFQSVSQEVLDPFPGIFTDSFLPSLQQSIKEGQYSIRRIIQTCPSIQWVSLEAKESCKLQSINTPFDLERLNDQHLLFKETTQ